MKLNFKTVLVLLLLAVSFNIWAQQKYVRAIDFNLLRSNALISGTAINYLNYASTHYAFSQRSSDANQAQMVSNVNTGNDAVSLSENGVTSTTLNIINGTYSYVTTSELFYPYTNVIDRTALHNFIPEFGYGIQTIHFSEPTRKTYNTHIIPDRVDDVFLFGNEAFDKRNAPVQRPETYAIILTGVVLIGFAAKRRRTFYH
ncbi:hypothetical protein [Nitrosomonas marina]|uniref:PEP-CTERM protein-sorting domain-containing protein n=1 Tax=Nitrosomonas marina TaxID=917 RepID=A0A1H8HNU9_9PROT|nr:hypothetical protein [Nitrosomonas marina]SEN57646.1 hypothetical protein SAMN05216325_12514 [Nitrosomonas marina]